MVGVPMGTGGSEKPVLPATDQIQVAVGHVGGHSPARGPLQQTDLKKEWLVGILDGLRLFPDRDRKRGQSNRTASELQHHRLENGTIDLVQAQVVYFIGLEGLEGSGHVHPAVGPGYGEIPDPGQEPVGDAGSSPASSRDQIGCLILDLHFQYAGGSSEDLGQFGVGVIVEAILDPEPIPQWRSDFALARSGADQSEPWEVDPD